MEQIRVCTHDRPGAKPVIRTVPWPEVGKKAALIKVGACGVCGTDLHILKGHWPKPLPWPFTLGHELGGVIVECCPEFTEDFMSKPLKVGSKVMIPPLMPCSRCYYCIHYPQSANKCLTPVYCGRYLGFDKAPHMWGGWAEYVYVYVDLDGGGGRDGDEDGEVDHRAMARIGRVRSLFLLQCSQGNSGRVLPIML